jgi:hypothetical protein
MYVDYLLGQMHLEILSSLFFISLLLPLSSKPATILPLLEQLFIFSGSFVSYATVPHLKPLIRWVVFAIGHTFNKTAVYARVNGAFATFA